MTDSASASERVTPRHESRRQAKLIVGGAIVVLAVAYLLLTAARGATAYYLTVAEIRAQGPAQRNVRVAGTIVGESIVWSARELRLEFDVTDESGRLPVVYHGARPDMFRDGAQVVLEGQYAPEGRFRARSMLLKCPSKYEEAK